MRELTKYNLTSDQKVFWDEFVDFIDNDFENIYILKGYAGTGKTFMLKLITDYLNKRNRKHRLMAPTGRAAKVITDKTGNRAFTIHKSIYSFDKQAAKKVKKNEFKYSFKLRSNEDEKDTIYIIDEASMISGKYSEAEFFTFGSGELLKDLFLYIHQGGLSPKRKILFVGDPAQLPPVNTNISPALDINILSGYGFEVREHTLTEVVRQEDESGILSKAGELRENINLETYDKIEFENYFHDIDIIYHNDFLEEYLSASDFHSENDSIVIAYSNRSAQHYNKWIRSHFYPEQKNITTGDRVMVTTNNYSYPIELLNGDFGVVVFASEETETTKEPVYVETLFGPAAKTAPLKKVDLVFRDCVIRFEEPGGNQVDVECKILDNLLYSNERDISPEERKALIIDFQNRYPKLKPGSDEYIEVIGADEYVNALRLKFGYAITGHKSQGGEWNNVFLDVARPFKVNDEAYTRWLYTALTRAKQKLFIIKPFDSLNDF